MGQNHLKPRAVVTLLISLALSACVGAPDAGGTTIEEFGASPDGKADASNGTLNGYLLCRRPFATIRCPGAGGTRLHTQPASWLSSTVTDLSEYDVTYGSCQEIDDPRDDNRDGGLRSANFYCYAMLTPRWAPAPPAEPIGDGYREISPGDVGDVPMYVLGSWQVRGEEPTEPFVERGAGGDLFVSKLSSRGTMAAIYRGDPASEDIVGGLEAGNTWGLDEELSLVDERLREDGSIVTLTFYRLVPYEALP